MKPSDSKRSDNITEVKDDRGRHDRPRDMKKEEPETEISHRSGRHDNEARRKLDPESSDR